MKKPYNYKICKYDFFDTAIADILRAIDGDCLLGSLILSFCTIDYMGLALNPNKKNTGSDFKKFVKVYMGSINPKYLGISEQIWAVRNSLVHTYGKSDATEKMNLDFQLSHQDPERHLDIVRDGERQKILINLPEFVSEIIAAVEKLFRDNAENDVLLKCWYEKLLIIQGADAVLQRILTLVTDIIPHSQSHKLLKILETNPPLGIDEICAELTTSLTNKLNG
jgi:hypothetical protein